MSLTRDERLDFERAEKTGGDELAAGDVADPVYKQAITAAIEWSPTSRRVT